VAACASQVQISARGWPKDGLPARREGEQPMRGKGINYGTGSYPDGTSSREHFKPAVVQQGALARQVR
jgi:hypothetical protein